MELNKLGKKSKGVKYFSLNAQNELGYTVKCSNARVRYTFNNINEIEWTHQGVKVYMSSKHHTMEFESYDLSMWHNVTIAPAEKVAVYLLDTHRK